MYSVRIVPSALRELRKAPAFYRTMIEDAIEKQLPSHVDQETKNRKRLRPLLASFAHAEPLWELRAGDWRVLYDVDDEEHCVVIRSIRLKAGHRSTKEIL